MGRLLYVEGDRDTAAGGRVQVCFSHTAHRTEHATLAEAMRFLEIYLGKLIAAGHRWMAAEDKVQKTAMVIQVRVAARAAWTSLWNLSAFFQGEKDRSVPILHSCSLQGKPGGSRNTAIRSAPDLVALQCSGAGARVRVREGGLPCVIRDFVNVVANACRDE